MIYPPPSVPVPVPATPPSHTAAINLVCDLVHHSCLSFPSCFPARHSNQPSSFFARPAAGHVHVSRCSSLQRRLSRCVVLVWPCATTPSLARGPLHGCWALSSLRGSHAGRSRNRAGMTKTRHGRDSSTSSRQTDRQTHRQTSSTMYLDQTTQTTLETHTFMLPQTPLTPPPSRSAAPSVPSPARVPSGSRPWCRPGT